MGPKCAGEGLTSFLSVDHLDKSFGDHRVLDGISLDVEGGEILVLLGPSGSGKTTLLRILAGFEAADAGSLWLAGSDITHQPPIGRNFGMVFQHYALFPHLTVGENVAFGLESRRLPRNEIERRVVESLDLVDLKGFERRRVGQISGGQQQRVALARALAPEPQVLLLDEPLSNLDPGLRERTRRELTDTLRAVGITAVWVTHEQEEAFAVGDKVAVLQRGKLEQIGTPEELYLEPQTPFVARFVGRASTLRGVAGSGGTIVLKPRGDENTDRDHQRTVEWQVSGSPDIESGSPVELLIRPEELTLVAKGEPRSLAGRVVETRFAGASSFVRVQLDTGGSVEVAAVAEVGRAVGVRATSADSGGPAGRVYRESREGGG